MIPELESSIDASDGRATLLAPGPSTEILPDTLHDGVALSVNGIYQPARFQFSADSLDLPNIAIYLETVTAPIPRDDFHIVERFESETWGPLFKDGRLNHKLNSVPSAFALLIMNGATEIRVFGQDGCDPTGQGYSRWMRKPRDDHYFDLIASEHKRFEKVCWTALMEHEVTVYNMSPFSRIEPAERLFKKYGHYQSYLNVDV